MSEDNSLLANSLSRRHVVTGLVAAPFVAKPLAGALAQSVAIPTIKIVNTSGNGTMTVQKLMERKGFLKDQRINLDIMNIADGSKIMGALLSGTADVSMMAGFAQVLTAIEKGGKLKLIAGALMKPFHAMYSKRPEIKSIADLKGKTVGIGSPGALLHSMVVPVLRKNGISEKDVTFVNIGSNLDVFRAVVAGTIDAGPSEVDFYYQQDKYGVHALKGGELWNELPDFTVQATFTSDEMIKKRRDDLVRTLAGFARVYRYAASPESRDDFFAARAEALSKDDKHEAEIQWSFYKDNKVYATDLVLSEERVRFMQELNVSLGVQKTVLPYEAVADMSLARDALKLIS